MDVGMLRWQREQWRLLLCLPGESQDRSQQPQSRRQVCGVSTAYKVSQVKAGAGQEI